jgi:iron(III) transport system substrate-binding protein
MTPTKSLLSILCLLSATMASAQDKVLNIYSARHYPTDEVMYSDFTKATGIKINRVDADDAGILARLKAEGAASPADVILLVDAARLWRAEVDGLFRGGVGEALVSKGDDAENDEQDADDSGCFHGEV